MELADWFQRCQPAASSNISVLFLFHLEMAWAAYRADWRKTVVHLRASFVAGLADHQQMIGLRVYHAWTAHSRGAQKGLGFGRNLHVQKQGNLLEAVLRRLRLNSTRFSVCHPRLPLPRLGVTEPV
jgi:hypothetical protein